MLLLWSRRRKVELKVGCWRWFTSDAVANVDVPQGDLRIRRMENVAVDLGLLVNVYWDWRAGSRALGSEGSVCDVRMVALSTHLYSESSSVVSRSVAMYSR